MIDVTTKPERTGWSGPSGPRQLDPAGLSAVDEVLDQQVDHGGEVLTEVSPDLGEVVGSVRALLHGGKRLRAAFCLWGARGAAGDEAVPGATEAAAALEMFHLAALVHDDVMDRSPSRRGSATVHQDFAERHRRRAGGAGAATFGDGVGVLVGDLCLTWSDDLLSTALRAGRSDRSLEARRVWEQMRTQVLAGQYLDLLAQSRPGTTTDDVTRVLLYKSAKYTVEHPLLLGATIAGAGPALLQSYSDLGLRVGEAFQLRDDVLGVLGNPGVTGKSNLDDVREGKRTMVVAHAEAEGTPEQQAVLRRHLGDEHLDAAGLAAVRRVLHDTGAVDRVEERIAVLVAEAHDVLAAMPVGTATRDALGVLTDACAWRSA